MPVPHEMFIPSGKSKDSSKVSASVQSQPDSSG